MDIDMHYHGTFALARAAGLKREVAETIAYAAQFVDDSTDAEGIDLDPSGAFCRAEVTAHHPADLPANRNLEDQRMVWVPFHFLPGGAGAELTERLVCNKDSAIARTLVKHHLDQAERSYAVELIGVLAHVYADTFAHYGFSGVSSRHNMVLSDQIQLQCSGDVVANYLGPRVLKFFKERNRTDILVENFRRLFSATAEALSGALGHGAVAVYPDQPYLTWQFHYEHDYPANRTRTVVRNNTKDFMDASRALHELFRQFVQRRPKLADGSVQRDWDQLKGPVEAVLRTEGDIPVRNAAWQKALIDGKITGKTEPALAPYSPRTWYDQRPRMAKKLSTGGIGEFPLYRFYQAASYHRHFVLRDLLPAYNINVI